jgi:hypothetical protein
LTNGSALSRDRDPCVRRGGVICTFGDNRRFVGRVATHVLAFAGDSKVASFDGDSCKYASVPGITISPFRLRRSM